MTVAEDTSNPAARFFSLTHCWRGLAVVVIAAWAFSLSVGAAAAALTYADAQYYGLESLYNATSGNDWETQTGWRNSTLGVCGWYGVTCDDNVSGNVTGLSLASNSLLGNLTQAGAPLSSISSLREMDLSNNQLVGPVPLELGLMSRLEVLDLSRNFLSSIPATWGAGATSLQHLRLGFNNISGSLPVEWLDLNDSDTSSTSYPFVHSKESSSWLPELRTLTLSNNNITMTVYRALQSVIGWSSLQSLDFSGNTLVGTLKGAFDSYYCEEDITTSSGNDDGACRSVGFKAGASLIAILLLSSNFVSGGLAEDGIVTLPPSLSVLTVSDNLLEGPVPDSFSQLAVFFADGNGGLNSTSLPSFASYSNSSSTTVQYGNLTCPVISGENSSDYVDGEQGANGRLRLDPSYLEHRHCVCKPGMEGNAQAGCQPCGRDTYREDGVGLFSSRYCAACPANAGTMFTGADSASDCKCASGFYDTLAGVNDSGPICAACPFGGIGWNAAGAISGTACACPAGSYLDAGTAACADCPAGKYKSAIGNDMDLCVPCAEGTYSATTGITSSAACTPCEAGTYSTTLGATSSSACSPCPSGTFSSLTGLSSLALCATCPAGYYQEYEGATDADSCEPCDAGTFSTEIGASSEDSCKWCEDGLYSQKASNECETSLTNSRRTLVIYLIVGSSTLAGITISYYTWQKRFTKKRKLVVDRRTETPLKMARAKRTAQLWAVMFHTLEAIDVITGNALFIYLLERGTIRGVLQYIYWLVVSIGIVLNVYRLYKVLWAQFFLTKISVAQKEDKEGKPILVVYQPGRTKQGRRIMTSDDAKMVLELVKILKHLQVNKFKVLLAVVMDLPLTFLNLDILWTQDPGLIKSPLFLTSLIIAVFSAGKISTLIEYHLELRQRKRKLERLLMLELNSSHDRQGGQKDGAWNDAASGSIDGEEEGDCFEHGYPETLLQFHGASMRNIVAADPNVARQNNGKKGRRYLQLSPGRLSPKLGVSRRNRGSTRESAGREGSTTGRWGRSSVSGTRTTSPQSRQAPAVRCEGGRDAGDERLAKSTPPRTGSGDNG